MFREKDALLYPEGGERVPLLEHPIIWTRSNEFPMISYRLQREQKKQRFQWLLFFAAAMLSLFLFLILVATVSRYGIENEIGTGTTTSTTPGVMTSTTPVTTPAELFSNLTTPSTFPTVLPFTS